MRTTSRSIDGVAARALTVDGFRLTEEWIEPDPWSWVYRQPRHGRVAGPVTR